MLRLPISLLCCVDGCWELPRTKDQERVEKPSLLFSLITDLWLPPPQLRRLTTYSRLTHLFFLLQLHFSSLTTQISLESDCFAFSPSISSAQHFQSISSTTSPTSIVNEIVAAGSLLKATHTIETCQSSLVIPCLGIHALRLPTSLDPSI